MKYIFLSLLIALVVLAQASFLPPLGINLNLLLILSLSILFLGFANGAYYSAFVGGLLLDLLSSGFLGISSLLMLLIVAAVGMARKALGVGFWTLIPVTFVGAVVFRRGDWRGAALDAVAVLILFPLVRWLLSRMLAEKELRIHHC